MASPAVVLRVYRQILRNAKAFPSIKRDALIDNIKVEFRENRHLTDEAQVQEKLDVAVTGLQQLRAYTGFDDEDPNWSVRMTETPMPKPGGDDEDAAAPER